MKRIKVFSKFGWSGMASALVSKLCKEHNLPFIDRAGVPFHADERPEVVLASLDEAEAQKLEHGYIFFGHRGMLDLTTVNVNSVGNLL